MINLVFIKLPLELHLRDIYTVTTHQSATVRLQECDEIQTRNLQPGYANQ